MPSTLPTDEPAAVPCPGGLYVVATPIGNLEDITVRALRILKTVALIAAEDTRHTARLLAHYHIRTPLISCHEHNEQQRTDVLIEKIRAGMAVALVSDAGTPSVSDPGYRLVRATIAAGLDVFPVPGVSAAITALSAAGLPTDTFTFVGFTPKKKGRRDALLQSLAGESRTLIFYESPHRIIDFLADLQRAMGDRPAVLAREMTKLHEEFVRGTLSQLAASLKQRSEIKGECTLLLSGAPSAESIGMGDLADRLREALADPDARLSGVAKEVARKYQLPRKTVYELALKVRHEMRQGEEKR